MERPSRIEYIQLVAVLRTLNRPQDEVAGVLHFRKSSVVAIEKWLSEAPLADVEPVFDTQAVQRLVSRELPSCEEASPELLVRAPQVTADDILRHYRNDYVRQRTKLQESPHQSGLRQLTRDWLDQMGQDKPLEKLLKPLTEMQAHTHSAAGLLRICEQMERTAAALENLSAGPPSASTDFGQTKAETDVSFPQLLEHLKNDQAGKTYEEMRSMEREIVSLVGYEFGVLSAYVPGFVAWSLDAGGRQRIRQDALYREQLAGSLPKVFSVLLSEVLLLVCDDVKPGHPLQRYRVAIDICRSESLHQFELSQAARGLLLSLLEPTGSATSPPKPAFDMAMLRNLIVSVWKTSGQQEDKDPGGHSVSPAAVVHADLSPFNEGWIEVCHRLRTDALRIAELWPAWMDCRERLHRRLAAVAKEYPFVGTCTGCSDLVA